MYCAMYPTITCAVYDSPYSNLMKLAKEIAVNKTGLPEFIIKAGLSFISDTIYEKAKFDISELDIV